jgi:FtsZ-binding cell division protein ZapB
MSKANFEKYRNKVKQKIHTINYLTQDNIHELDHPSTFMKMIKVEHIQHQVTMMRYAKSYLCKSFEMELWTILKRLGTRLMDNLDRLVQVTYLV